MQARKWVEINITGLLYHIGTFWRSCINLWNAARTKYVRITDTPLFRVCSRLYVGKFPVMDAHGASSRGGEKVFAGKVLTCSHYLWMKDEGCWPEIGDVWLRMRLYREQTVPESLTRLFSGFVHPYMQRWWENFALCWSGNRWVCGRYQFFACLVAMKLTPLRHFETGSAWWFSRYLPVS